ncbi:dolichyl-phosphate-mannose--protein mannosyltransferase [Nocardioides sp.]|uniref:dolichyl-phosphate-mannose--protein mannosyltransferase n=1 Tax=Nocardioides sp. TaxID=35761 RepID=UPI0027162E52|nr:phospholipid carrier-dependent glycosyltransferase [Nocardioides sp.]MDO9457310.1 phospholipid carrier-dependent glycosyltransferase [Nocardioides sp.]
MTTLQEPPRAGDPGDPGDRGDGRDDSASRAGATGLSETADGRPVPTAWQRARGRAVGLESRLNDRFAAWAAALAVSGLALGMRLWHLGTPDRFAFDETYYAKDAWGLLNQGYVRNYQEKPGGKEINDAILSGQVKGIWGDGPSMEVHPEAGKWMIALGEKAFGMDPFGWRISAAVVGTLMVLIMCRLVRRMTGSTVLGCLAGLLMAFDGLHFVLSRLALLDIFLAFFLLCGVACIVNDRDWYRAKLGRLVDDATPDSSSWGPVRGLLFRPWMLAAGVSFGLAIGTKWTALYPLAAFGLLAWLWSAGARRSFGVRHATARSVLADGVPAFVQLVLVAFFVYVVSWTGWLVHADDYEQALSSTQYTGFTEERPCVTGADGELTTDNVSDDSAQWPTATEPDASGLGEVVQSLRSLWYYHHDVYIFHTHYLNCSSHTYQSQPSGWLLVNRPVGAATQLEIQPGQQGCNAPAGSECYRQVLLIGTPILWWGGILALIAAGVLWVGARDWRFGVAVVGVLSTWLPWLQYDDRPIFFFYAIASLPFIVLAIVLCLGKLIGSSRQPSPRRTTGVIVAGSFFVLVVLNFAYFYPILSYEVIPKADWIDRMWFSRWI